MKKITPHQQLNLMFKTVSEDCNLACDYCYYSTCRGNPGKKINTINLDILEKIIMEYMIQTKGVATFIWQGGEPLLAGLNFFEKVIELQLKYAPPYTMISNSIQTNGTLITEKWAKFFKKYSFLVGVSIDGPKEIHDKRRVNSIGRGSRAEVMRGIQWIRQENVDFNIITVIHQDNVNCVDELFAFYKKELIQFVQFIPCMDFQAKNTNQQRKFLITPDQYGKFLCQAFDKWNDDNFNINIHHFNNFLSMCEGNKSQICFFAKKCSATLVIESNGDVFPCDFYISDDYKLGNIETDTLKSMLYNERYKSFSEMKSSVSNICSKCEFFTHCHGGCPRNRIWNTINSSEPDYFCQSYKAFYAHAEKSVKKFCT
ncbi:anaerobic sulfatase maturase [Bacillaceae bacterium Marseille-Q3522]|nr:anaerobic sulfatase maturase [Bacillaceae bacterium Marseille-Q3522]